MAHTGGTWHCDHGTVTARLVDGRGDVFHVLIALVEQGTTAAAGNGALIAGAPALLEMCRRAAEYIRDDLDADDPTPLIVEDLEAAIAAATREE